MNKFLILSFLPGLFFTFGLLKAQDTIVKRNNEKLIVHLTEVNPDNVRYTRFDYQTGPAFTLSKQEINYVRYANGIMESFSTYSSPAQGNSFPGQGTGNSYVSGSGGPDLSMQISGNKYYFKGLMIEEADMLAVAGKLKDKKINLMIKKVQDQEFIQKATTIGGIALFVSGLYVYAKNRPFRGGRRGGGVPIAATSAQTQGQQTGDFLMLAGLASEVVSISFKISRTRHAHLVVESYNKAILH